MMINMEQELEHKIVLPAELDEAAREYANIKEEGDKEKYVNGYLYNGFFAGAKWMAEQGQSREGVVSDDAEFIIIETDYFVDLNPCLNKKMAIKMPAKAKVIVQIREIE